MIVASNRRAEALFCQPPGCLLGLMAGDVLPEALLQLLQTVSSGDDVQLDGGIVTLNEGASMHVLMSTMGDTSQSKGIIMALSPLKGS